MRHPLGHSGRARGEQIFHHSLWRQGRHGLSDSGSRLGRQQGRQGNRAVTFAIGGHKDQIRIDLAQGRHSPGKGAAVLRKDDLGLYGVEAMFKLAVIA